MSLLEAAPPTALPHSEMECVAWLRLIRSRRVGPVTFHRLLAEYGSAAAALAALPAIARAAGVDGYTPCPEAVAWAEYRAAQRIGARALLHGAPDYPAALLGQSDAPPLLWARGALQLLQRPMLAMVGARNVSSLGCRMTRHLATEVGALGFVVVSGLARGVDAEAHQASLASGTVAVVAGGVDVATPEAHQALLAQIVAQGLVLSEQPIGLVPQARHFPLRNRIIAGLAQAVLVVEAAARSGSLITARDALDIGREVMAVPGHPFDARAAGCNMLIRDGATLIRGAEDVREALQPIAGAKSAARPGDAAPLARPAVTATPRTTAGKPISAGLAAASRLHNMILDRLGPSPLAEDQLIRDLDLPPEDCAAELLSLELKGEICRQAGGLISRS